MHTNRDWNRYVMVIGLGGIGAAVANRIRTKMHTHSHDCNISFLAIDTDVVDTITAKLQRKYLAHILKAKRNNGSYTVYIIESLVGSTSSLNSLAALREIEHMASYDYVRVNAMMVSDDSAFEGTTRNDYRFSEAVRHTRTPGYPRIESLRCRNMKRCSVQADEIVPSFGRIHLYKDSREQFELRTLIYEPIRRGDHVTQSYFSRPWITRCGLCSETNHQTNIFYLISDAGSIISAAQNIEDCLNECGEALRLLRCGYQGCRNNLSNVICAETGIVSLISQSLSPECIMFSPKQKHKPRIIQQCPIDAAT